MNPGSYDNYRKVRFCFLRCRAVCLPTVHENSPIPVCTYAMIPPRTKSGTESNFQPDDGLSKSPSKINFESKVYFERRLKMFWMFKCKKHPTDIIKFEVFGISSPAAPIGDETNKNKFHARPRRATVVVVKSSIVKNVNSE